MKEGDLELLIEIARFEDSHDMEKEFKIGWSWRHVRIWPSTLSRLFKDGYLDNVFRSNSYTGYRLSELGRAIVNVDQQEKDAEPDTPQQLDIIKDIPAAKAIYAFTSTDMAKAKAALGQTVCIRGNVPLSLLASGTRDNVSDYRKALIDFCGRDGGFIMDSSNDLDDADPENVKAMFDFTREYSAH